MPIIYDGMVNNKIISKINSGEIKSYEETYTELTHYYSNKFMIVGYADMCWNLRNVQFDYAVTRAFIHNFNTRFAEWKWWKNLTDEQKEKLIPLMRNFEDHTNIILGMGYDNHPSSDDDILINKFGISVIFLPGFEKENPDNPCIIYKDKCGHEIRFSENKENPDFKTRIKFWENNGTYAFTKLVSAINDNRINVKFDNSNSFVLKSLV